ncbi:IS701 family transposase [Sphingomonas paucimobilis]|jgi:SRSO17 transposase|nr:IS701 family transposase [Sphingomonas paucimobilis]QBE90851.1 IS701 family transposase [Sphingomonas paucimobilis]QBE90866.1 IS701 family transposase [Sphingomonas paucimobilis]QBE91516.1 IS701 family transposase [Sphingomonas paucimobilis]QBE92614.1 IS701 family transposase [Sphingomonas paucimobilis]
MVVDEGWRSDLERWLEPFLAGLSHPARRRMCPLYIAGLIGPGDRKSVQPMAARAGDVGYDQLHHFVAAGVWDSVPLEAALLKEADRLVGDRAGFLVIDDTALPKKGQHSVGVAPQYASSLGKTSNCQSLVSVTLASREVPVMVGLRLFLPESWTDDAERMTRARIPLNRQKALTKPEIAIEEIDRVIASGVRFGCVLADAGYGSSGPFRQALSERGLLWAVGLSRRQNVYPADVGLVFPVAAKGRRRQYHMPDRPPVSAEAMLSDEKWRKISWRRGTKGRLTCLFAARRVRIAEGHKHRMLDNRMQCMPGDEVWLVGERRSTGEQKYYVSNLPVDATLKALAAAIKARWICEQAHQQLKEELGLDHFEGRSWIGLHRHGLMTMIAYAFLQSRRLKAAGRKKKSRGSAAKTEHASHQAGDPQPLRSAAATALPSL